MEVHGRGTVWLYLAPTLGLLGAVAGWPLARTAYLAFTDADLADPGRARWIGLENFVFLAEDPDWWLAFANSLLFTGVSVSAELVLGLAFALVLDASFRGRGLLRAAVLLPRAIPTVVSAQLWGWMFNDLYGVVNAALTGIGLLHAPVAWLADPPTALGAVIVADVWKTTPFVALLLLAGLQTIPREVYEAARVDGVGPWGRLAFIVLPLLRPALLLALVFRTLDALRMFDLIYVMTGNSRQTATMAVYARQQLVDFQETGYGSAVSLAVFAIVAAVTVAYVMLLRARFAGGER